MQGDETNQQNDKPQFIPELTWSAAEHIEHKKSASWYIYVVLIMLTVSGVVFFFTRDWFSSAALAIFVIIFMVFAARKPKLVQYALGSTGIQIDQRYYPLETFRSFAVIDEGSFHSLSLQPTRRFQPALNIYFGPQEEQQIINYLGGFMPYEEKQQNYIDQFMNRIKF